MKNATKKKPVNVGPYSNLSNCLLGRTGKTRMVTRAQAEKLATKWTLESHLPNAIGSVWEGPEYFRIGIGSN